MANVARETPKERSADRTSRFGSPTIFSPSKTRRKFLFFHLKKLVELQTESRTIGKRLDETKDFYLREEKSNKFVEKLLRSAEKKVFQMRNEEKCRAAENERAADEIVALKLKVRRTNDEIQLGRTAVEQLSALLEEKNDE